MGYAPIMQISCRDKNRIAIQGDVLGASAMGVQNILCLTGDGVQAGDQPGAKPVFDLDCMSLLETIRIMRDNSKFLSGRKLTSSAHGVSGRGHQPVRAAP
jgi:5,10-methylenetetrahydrofolate reductase